MAGIGAPLLVALAGFVVGLVFGATVQRTNYCAMGSISDVVLLGDWRRFRAWVLAIAVAILGTQALAAGGLIEIRKSIYLASSFGWLGAIAGGLLFGFGMTLAGGCGSKTLVRLGGGNLKSLVVAVFLGVSAYATMRGLLATARRSVETATNVDLAQAGYSSQGVPELIAGATGAGAGAVRWSACLLAAAVMLWFCFKDPAFRASARDVGAGLVLGLLVPIGWAVTGVLGADDFEPTPLASLTFVAPVGEALQYLMIFTGAKINFGIAVVGGVIAGAFLAAWATGSVRVEGFVGVDDTVRHMAGGLLMGAGGVMAMGCTIGQGITGMSTLALGSVLAWLAIVAGGVYGIKYLEQGSLAGALRALVARSA